LDPIIHIFEQLLPRYGTHNTLTLTITNRKPRKYQREISGLLYGGDHYCSTLRYILLEDVPEVAWYQYFRVVCYIYLQDKIFFTLK
jgi:hypothetical protein